MKRRIGFVILCAFVLLASAAPVTTADPTEVDFGEAEINVWNNNVAAYVEIDDDLVPYDYSWSENNGEPLYVTIDTMFIDNTNQAVDMKFLFHLAVICYPYGYPGETAGSVDDTVTSIGYDDWDSTANWPGFTADELMVEIPADHMGQKDYWCWVSASVWHKDDSLFEGDLEGFLISMDP